VSLIVADRTDMGKGVASAYILAASI